MEEAMKTRRVAPFAVLSTLVLVLGAIVGLHELVAVASPSPSADHNVHVRKVQNKWKVVQAQDSTKTLVKAKRGDYIVWKAVGSDAFFQFQDSTLFGTDSGIAAAGKTLRLQVSSTADSGRHIYSVFCLKDRAFATGDSPPVIIVE